MTLVVHPVADDKEGCDGQCFDKDAEGYCCEERSCCTKEASCDATTDDAGPFACNPVTGSVDSYKCCPEGQSFCPADDACKDSTYCCKTTSCCNDKDNCADSSFDRGDRYCTSGKCCPTGELQPTTVHQHGAVPGMASWL